MRRGGRHQTKNLAEIGAVVTEFRATVRIIDRFVRLLIVFPDKYIGFVFLVASINVRAEILYSKYFSIGSKF